MLRSQNVRKKNARRRGSELVEFALVSLQLLLVIFGVFEFARMALVYDALANSSRIAARYAITHGADRDLACASSACGSTDGSATAADICGAAGKVATFADGMDKAKVVANCTVTNAGGTVGSTVQVTVTYPYDPFFGLLPLGTVTLGSTSAGVITY